MKHRFFLLSFLLLASVTFAQSQTKPFNKGKFKIDASYSRLMQKYPSFDYPDFRVGVGYGITNWCVVGVFGSYGTHENNMKIGGGFTIQGTDTIYHPVVYEGKQTERYYHYGIDAELHPLSLLLPSFYIVDIYCRGELGMRTATEQYVPDYEGPLTEPVRNSFLYGGSVGVAINPSRYFGVFYELAYDNLNKKTKVIDHELGLAELTPKGMHRFGINIRFGGPKKWQNQQ